MPNNVFCPKCQKYTGLPDPDGELHHGERPEGLSGTTLVQCQDPECLHEWEIATHGQMVRSLRLWSGAMTGGGITTIR